jgi:ABC-type molybdenum transport system ATPase subunit/photorepair protein PhrA
MPRTERDAYEPEQSAPAPAAVLQISNLAVQFGTDQPILSNISFGLKANEIAFVRGPSGIGKSRLLRAIAELETAHVRFLGDMPCLWHIYSRLQCFPMLQVRVCREASDLASISPLFLLFVSS